ncbi:hypothetical protein H2200_009693 [Cladophialophora chaetospira]|uniref:Uncharacterized protein n=1 Tax=Cladophialophora chaetospira TaxID=386627 RepID=A0AA38X300_9EURO|nr:hypothetical protein H2200_009693 [Cladophialophora chaetospira]
MATKRSITDKAAASTPLRKLPKSEAPPTRLREHVTRIPSPTRDCQMSPGIPQHKLHGLRKAVSHSELKTVNPIFSAITLPPSCPPGTNQQNFVHVLTLIAAGHHVASVLEEHLPCVTEAQLICHLAGFGAKSWGATEEVIAAEKDHLTPDDNIISPSAPFGDSAADGTKKGKGPTPNVHLMYLEAVESIKLPTRPAEMKEKEHSASSNHLASAETRRNQPPTDDLPPTMALDKAPEEGEFTTISSKRPGSASRHTRNSASKASISTNGSRFSALEVDGEKSGDDIESEVPLTGPIEARHEKAYTGKRRKRKNNKKKMKSGAPTDHSNSQVVRVASGVSALELTVIDEPEVAITVIDPEDEEVYRSLQLLLQIELIVFILWVMVAFPVRRLLF